LFIKKTKNKLKKELVFCYLYRVSLAQVCGIMWFVNHIFNNKLLLIVMSKNSKNKTRTLLVTGIIILVFIVSLIALRKDASAPYTQELVEDEFSFEVSNIEESDIILNTNFSERVSTVQSFGDFNIAQNKYQDIVNNFEIKLDYFDQNDLISDYRETVTHFPFYPEERFEGRVLANDVHMYVIDREYIDFISGFSYGLLIPFISDSGVLVTPRTTGSGDNFLHQSFIDLRNGKILLLTHKTNSSEHSALLSNLHNSIFIQ